MKKILTLILVIAGLGLIGSGVYFSLSNNGKNKTSTENNENVVDKENEKEEKEETFDEKLQKLVYKEASDQEIINLFRDYVEIEIEQVTNYQFIVKFTNNTPYDLGTVNIIFNPKKDGVSVYNPYKTIDRTTSFEVVSSGETVYAVQGIVNLEKNSETKEQYSIGVDCDELVIQTFKFKNYYEPASPYEDIYISNVRYDNVKGVLYTIENKSNVKKYPNVEVLFYKDNKIVWVENKTVYGLEASSILNVEHSYNTLYEKYELPSFEFDNVTARIMRK